MINVQNVSKTFILHQQNGVRLPVLQVSASPPSTPANAWYSTAIPAVENQLCYARCMPTSSTDEGQIQIKHGDEWVDTVTAPARKVVEDPQNHCRLGKPVSARHPTYFGTGSGDAAAARYRRTA